jgi:hypothetical protein
MNKTVLCATTFCVLLAAPAASANPISSTFPAIGSNTGPAIIVTVNPDSSVTVSPGPGAGVAYDGDEDSYIGIVNNSGNTLLRLTLSASGNPFNNFDGDGVNNASSTNGNYQNGVGFINNADTTTYAGPNAVFQSGFTGNSATLLFGHIGNGAPGNTFVFNGLAPGERTITSAETAPSSLSFTGGFALLDPPVPEPTSLVAFTICVGGLALARRVRRSA